MTHFSVFRFCGGLLLDIKRKAPFFVSDFTDAFHIQALSAILFIYLGTVTNAITFGGLLGDATENMQVRLRCELFNSSWSVFHLCSELFPNYSAPCVQGVLESFLGTAITGGIFCLLAGQPLTILSSTGPVLVFERLLFNFSKYVFSEARLLITDDSGIEKYFIIIQIHNLC